MIKKTLRPFTMRLKIVLGVALSFVLAACTASPTPTVAPSTAASPVTTAPTAASTKQAGTAIHDIQGAGHISPLAGKTVKGVQGIVTAIRSDGFYMQDPNPDNDEATSEGIFVFTTTLPKLKIGDLVNVEGDVKEFYPRDIATGDLPITEIIKPTFTVVSSGNKLPDPIIIGTGGRIPPNKVIKSEKGDADQTKFNPKTDGIDFYESLESMLVQADDAYIEQYGIPPGVEPASGNRYYVDPFGFVYMDDTGTVKPLRTNETHIPGFGNTWEGKK